MWEAYLIDVSFFQAGTLIHNFKLSGNTFAGWKTLCCLLDFSAWNCNQKACHIFANSYDKFEYGFLWLHNNFTELVDRYDCFRTWYMKHLEFVIQQ